MLDCWQTVSEAEAVAVAVCNGSGVSSSGASRHVDVRCTVALARRSMSRSLRSPSPRVSRRIWRELSLGIGGRVSGYRGWMEQGLEQGLDGQGLDGPRERPRGSCHQMRPPSRMRPALRALHIHAHVHMHVHIHTHAHMHMHTHACRVHAPRACPACVPRVCARECQGVRPAVRPAAVLRYERAPLRCWFMRIRGCVSRSAPGRELAVCRSPRLSPRLSPRQWVQTPNTNVETTRHG